MQTFYQAPENKGSAGAEPYCVRHCNAFWQTLLQELFFYGMIFVDSYTLFEVN